MTPPKGLLEQLEIIGDPKKWRYCAPGEVISFYNDGTSRYLMTGGEVFMGKECPSAIARAALKEIKALRTSADERPSWDAYYLGLAQAASERASCPRLSVGAILVNDRAILSTGYNGSIRGMASCYEDGCDMVDGHCVRTVHAEINALAHATTSIIGSTLYCNYGPPCWGCFRVLANAGVQRYVYGKGYAPDPRVSEAAAALGLRIEQIGACP